MKNGILITFIIACITFIIGLATSDLIQYYKDKSSSSSSVESSAEYIESHEEDFISSTEKTNIIKLLDTMRNTDYDTVKVNDKVYNIIGYINANTLDDNIIRNKLNIYSSNIKALVLLDTPVTYIDEHNKSHTLESYRWLAYITDNYNRANLVTCAAVGEDGTIFTDIDYRYNDGVSIECVRYESLINQGIIEENTHWSVE